MKALSSSAQPVVRIVGGGLAGLTLGIGLRQLGIEVELYEAGRLPRHRVCGEFMAGLKLEMLRELGIEHCFGRAVIQRKVSWYLGERLLLQRETPEDVPGISRHHLDWALVERFEQLGGRYCSERRVRKEEATAPGWVWAAGREAERTDWLGYKAHFGALELKGDLEIHMGGGGYIGLSKVEDGRVNGCGLFRKQPGMRVHTSEALMAYTEAIGLGRLAERLRRGGLVEGTAVGVAGVNLERTPPGDGLLRIGDAFSVIPPFTGNGMTMAMEGAMVATGPISDWASGRIDWRLARARVRREQMKLFRWRLGVSRALHLMLWRPRWQRCLSPVAQAGLLPFRALYRLTH
ncbi:MAG: NAD(P)/FAD-dependent oxidoreductase [Puniceicoccaceae bacterium]